jgi:tRNA threonylcarbamoyladenosine biosynthesis protein TsaB
MSVLGIETATMVCAAAVASQGKILAESAVEERNIHAERVMSIIDDVLRRAGVSPRGLGAVAVSIGPGSFTGLRIGLSVAKGLAAAAEKPLVAVPTLEALARRVARPEDSGTRVLSLLDARRDEVYCQLFVCKEGSIEGCDEPQDLTLREVARLIGEQPVFVTGEGAGKFRAFMESSRPDLRPFVRFAEGPASRCSAATVALMGEELLGLGRIEDAAVLEPSYIKEFFFKTRH